jgi:hypothetical protein
VTRDEGEGGARDDRRETRGEGRARFKKNQQYPRFGKTIEVNLCLKQTPVCLKCFETGTITPLPQIPGQEKKKYDEPNMVFCSVCCKFIHLKCCGQYVGGRERERGRREEGQRRTIMLGREWGEAVERNKWENASPNFFSATPRAGGIVAVRAATST